MAFKIFATVVLFCAALTSACVFHTLEAAEWSYQNQSKWAAEYPACGAPNQSPINYVTSIEADPSLRPLVIANKFGGVEALEVATTHSTIVATVKRGGLTLQDPFTGAKSDLVQFHFHAPTEHTFDGNSAEVELHFVFRNPVDSSLTALGIRMVGANVSDSEYSFVDDVVSAAPEVADHAVVAIDRRITALHVLPIDGEYFSYIGSTTTPPCVANVRHITWKTIFSIRYSTLARLRGILAATVPGFPIVGTNRSVFPTLNRVVSRYVPKALLCEGCVGFSLQAWDARVTALANAITVTQNAIVQTSVVQHASNEWRVTLDASWLMWTGFLVVIMIPGFAMLEAGCSSRRNLFTVLFQNTTILGFCALIWWFCGYGFTFGVNTRNRNGFIGNDDILLVSAEQRFPIGKYPFFWYQFVVAVASTLIQSGATSERLTTTAWVVHTLTYLGVLYPVVAHWAWSTTGWFSPFTEGIAHIGRNGVLDLAGCGAIHMAGGASALAVLLLAGNRIGRYSSGVDQRKYTEGSNKLLKLFGTLLLWVGWYGFNPGSVLKLSNAYSSLAARSAISTALGPCAAAFTAFLVNALYKRKFDFDHVMNAALVGLVSVTGGSAIIEPWAAVVAGFIGFFFYQLGFTILKRRQIDDAVGAVPVHLFGGFWGLLVPGIFATQDAVEHYLERETTAWGFLYAGGGNQFGVQFFFGFVLFLWHFGAALVIFFVLRALGQLRITEEQELADLDEENDQADQYGAVPTSTEPAQELAEKTTTEPAEYQA